MILLFQDSTKLIEEGLKITPYNATAFGALVVVLSIAVFFLWRKLAQTETDYKDLAKEVVAVLAKVSLRLEDTKNDGELLKEMNLTLQMIKEKLNG